MRGADLRAGPAALAEAAAWIARLHADSHGAADETAFRAWLAADPAHQAAFAAVTETWDAAGGLRGVGRTTVPRQSSRRGVLVGLGAALAVAGAFGAWQRATAGVYQTGLGEQRRVDLEDGSELLLDTETRLRVRLAAHLRQVDLARGRVNCRVAPDPARPFVVEAGAERVTVTGTTVDIRRDSGQVSVICLQGDAEVEAGAVPRQRLGAGQRLKITSGRAQAIDRPALPPLVAWQDGQALFDNESLADAVREMNRYSRVKLVLDDPRLAGLRVSGLYHVGDNAAFARSITSLLPVLVRRRDDDLLLVPGPAQKSARQG